MNYVKKMCILRQIKQGFSGDGKTLSGLVKLEQYGKNLAVEVSIINFAPLVMGEYYCLLCDLKGVCEILPLRGKSLFNIITDLDVSDGFCAVICFVKTELTPIAYGVNGKATYNWRAIVNALPFAEPFHALHPSQEKAPDVAVSNSTAQEPLLSQTPPTPLPPPIPQENTPPMSLLNEKISTQPPAEYNDENVATNNYYEQKENEDEPDQSAENCHHAPLESGDERQAEQEQANFAKDVDDQGVLHQAAPESDEYHRAIQGELDELFQKYPRDKTLNGAFEHSEWVRVKGDKKRPLCLVGVIYEDVKPKYICYALPAENKNAPPQEIKDTCTFVPISPYDTEKGFFVIFQNAATGLTVTNPQS